MVASETKELQPPLLRGASLWGSPGPEKAEAPRQGPASPGEAAGRERVHSGGLSLLGNPPASSARAGEGQAHRTWVWVCKGGKIGGGGEWLDCEFHPAGVAVPECRRWGLGDGCGEGAVGGFERQLGRGRGQDTPPQPFLGNRPWEGARLSGGCCGPAVFFMYVCVKPYVTSHWFFVLGVIFCSFFVLIVKPSPVFKGGAAGGRLGREASRFVTGIRRFPSSVMSLNDFKKEKKLKYRSYLSLPKESQLHKAIFRCVDDCVSVYIIQRGTCHSRL